ncbi:mucin-2-like [Mizuhopecten yessoensis]|nr:mucin-2-like [Mizuhopecten yessoensis]
MDPNRYLLVVGICMCRSVMVSANIVTPNMFKYTPTNQANAALMVTGGSEFAGSSTVLPQNTVTGLPPTADWGPQQNTTADALSNTAWDAPQNAISDNSISSQGRLVIVDTNNTTPQDITAVNAGGGDVVLTMETVPNATPSHPAQSRTTDWNWIVTQAPKATPSPPTRGRATDWNWIVTSTPKATPSPPTRGRATDWNWIVTPTPRATPSPSTRKSNWNWIVTPAPNTPAPITPAPYTQVPNYRRVTTIGPTPFYYGNTNTMGYLGIGNTAGYFGTPPQWQTAHQQHPQQTTPFPGNKYGVCPLPSVVGAKCGYRCKRDSECGADWKCCHDGSGRPDGCCHARQQTEFESFMNSMWDMPPSQEIQNEMP